MTIRKKYSKEFKLDAVGLVTEQGYTQVDAAKSLGLNANMLGRWAKEFRATDGQAFRGNGKLTADQEELRKLKAQIKRLEMEKEILKKATVFFAAETKSTARMQEVEQCRSNCREVFVYHPA
jgi:transposase